jgi:hypothetical protein
MAIEFDSARSGHAELKVGDERAEPSLPGMVQFFSFSSRKGNAKPQPDAGVG